MGKKSLGSGFLVEKETKINRFVDPRLQLMFVDQVKSETHLILAALTVFKKVWGKRRGGCQVSSESHLILLALTVFKGLGGGGGLSREQRHLLDCV